jgi:hypothetical protein
LKIENLGLREALAPVVRASTQPVIDMSQAIDNPGEALSAVAENALALVRAELRLAKAEAKADLLRMSWGVGLLWLALLLTQVFVLLVALAPIFLSVRPWSSVALMLALALVPGLLAFWFAARELRRFRD